MNNISIETLVILMGKNGFAMKSLDAFEVGANTQPSYDFSEVFYMGADLPQTIASWPDDKIAEFMVFLGNMEHDRETTESNPFRYGHTYQSVKLMTEINCLARDIYPAFD